MLLTPSPCQKLSHLPGPLPPRASRTLWTAPFCLLILLRFDFSALFFFCLLMFCLLIFCLLIFCLLIFCLMQCSLKHRPRNPGTQHETEFDEFYSTTMK